MPSMTPHSRLRSIALAATVALTFAACGPATPSVAPTTSPSVPASGAASSPSSSVATDAIYDAIEAQVVEMRGLPAVDVNRETLDAEAAKAFHVKNFDGDNPPNDIAANQRLYKALGLLKPDQSLKPLYLDLIQSQVAGFYRPDDKKLYVVSRSGAIGGADKITFAHEYDHALQDGAFPVFNEMKELLDETDRALARAAIYEGDATWLMLQWGNANLTPEEFAAAQAAGADPESMAILAQTPPILVETLLFPYTAGAAFIVPIHTTGGWAAVDALYDDLPRSTEQILHPDKFRANEKPVAVELPATLAAEMGAGWTEAKQDTLGEFQLGVWLRESGISASDASAAAAGWGGDRLAVLNGPDEAWAIVMRTTWDAEEEATAFRQAAGDAVADAAHPATVIADGRDITVVFASAQDILDRAIVAAGYGAGG